MITRQNSIRNIISNITNDTVDDKEVAKLANMAEALDIKTNDALFPILVALQYYKVSFEAIPKSIKELTNSTILEHKNALNLETEKITLEYKKDIIHSTNRLFEQKLPLLIDDYIKYKIDTSLNQKLNQFEVSIENVNTLNIRTFMFNKIQICIYITILIFGICIGKFIF
jgi:methionine synthase I (cobalamin-dependent)